MFEFATATRIVFGVPLHDLAPELAAFEGPVLLVTGREAGRAAPLRRVLDDLRWVVYDHAVDGEPTVSSVSEAARRARRLGVRTVVAMGGGSVLDAGKAIAALMTNEADPLEYLEVIGRSRPLSAAPTAFVAVPTTAGTGSEVTRNAVLTSPSHRVKVSLRSSLMLPRLAWVDPSLCVSMPPSLTASTGMDALSQTLEAYVCHSPNPLMDPLCLEALARVARSLEPACRNGEDREARADMSYASLIGGLALANARLGAVHGFAAALGGMFGAAHGALCAALLAPVVRTNLGALRARAAGHPSLERYAAAARVLTGRPEAVPEDMVDWIEGLCRRIGVRPLAAFGVGAEHFEAVAEKAAAANSMKGNPVVLTAGERTETLRRAL